MNRLAIITILIFSVFINTKTLIAQTSTVGTLSVLYANGHPRSNLQGQINGMAGFENFLYTSWHYFTDPEIDRNEEIHIWNISDPVAPQLIGVLAFPGVLEGFEQTLNSPRSLAVIKGHLLFWSANRLYVYSINTNGTLTEQLVSSFADDLNPDGTGVFDIKGSYASTSRIMLSNNEFLQNPDEDRLQDYALINLQNPLQPFLETLNRDVGKDLLFLNHKLTGTFAGLPASLKLSQDASTLSVSTMASRRTAHFNQFWKIALQKLLGRKRLNVSLGSISTRIVAETNSKQLRTQLANSFVRKLNINNNYGFNEAISSSYADAATLRDVLIDLKIDSNDSLGLALEKIIEKVIRANFDLDLETILGRNLLKSFNAEIFGAKSRSIRAVQNDLRRIFQANVEKQGLNNYIVNSILNPLIGEQPIVRLKLIQVINRIADTPLGQATDLALGLFDAFYPRTAIESGLPFRVPNCFRIPRTSRDLLRQLLINAGPRLNANGIALFELIKLVDFYMGSGNFRRLTAELNGRVRDLHINLSSEFTNTVLAGLNIIAAPNAKLSQALMGISDRLQLEKALSVPLAQVISQRLSSVGINMNQSVSSYLTSQRLYIDPLLVPAGESLATIAGLKAKVSELGLDAVKLAALIRSTAGVAKDSITNVLQAVSNHLLKQLFGEYTDQTSLEKALENLINTKLTGKPFADFTSTSLNSILSNLSDQIPLPNVLGVISLASRGDCIAQWQRAIIATQTFASTSVVFEGLAVALQAWYNSLTAAYENVLKYITQTLLERFIAEIFNEAVRDYNSWYSRPTISNLDIPIAQILDTPAQFIEPISYQNLIGLVASNAVPFGNPASNIPASLTVFNPNNIAGTKVVISLGDWRTIESVRNTDTTLLIQGTKYVDNFPIPASLLVNLNGSTAAYQALVGDLAESISFADNMTLARGGQVLAVTNIAGQVVLMQTGKGK